MRILTIITIFLLIGVFYIISEKKLSVASTQDLQILKSDYGEWVLNTAKTSVGLVGQAIKMEWLPKIIIGEEENKTIKS